MPRRVSYKLTGTRFGALEVLGQGPEGGRYWLCKCDCGHNVISVPTEVLRWRGKKDCGCGIFRRGNYITEHQRMPSGKYKVKGGCRSMVPASFLGELGDPKKRVCHFCGEVPAINLVPGYGMLDDRFRAVYKDVRSWLTLCDICFVVLRNKLFFRTNRYDPGIILTSVPRSGNENPDYARMKDFILFAVAHQTADDAQTMAGADLLKIAKSLVTPVPLIV